nr:MAG TPA: hypothetical protein [Caudoviricetes sp.]
MNTVFEIEDAIGRKYIADEEWWLKQPIQGLIFEFIDNKITGIVSTSWGFVKSCKVNRIRQFTHQLDMFDALEQGTVFELRRYDMLNDRYFQQKYIVAYKHEDEVCVIRKGFTGLEIMKKADIESNPGFIICTKTG